MVGRLWERCAAVLCLVRAGVLHSYLHVEPCNYQASSAGAKLFFPHPGPGYGIARLAAVDQLESSWDGGGGN